RGNLPADSRLVIDPYLWVDLRETPNGAGGFPQAHAYWKVDRDPAVRNGVFGDDWRKVDYVIATPQLVQDMRAARLDLVASAWEHAAAVAAFDSGGWPVEVRRVGNLQQWDAGADPLLVRGWAGYKSRFLEGGRVVDPRAGRRTTSEGQAYALLRAVYMDDRPT